MNEEKPRPAFHSREWFIEALERHETTVKEYQARIERHVQAAEYSEAALVADKLREALEHLNAVANRFADIHGG